MAMMRTVLIGAAMALVATAPSTSASPRHTEQFSSSAGRPALILDRVPISFAVETFFQRISREPFILCSEVLSDDRLVSLRLPGHLVTARSFETFLQTRGYQAYVQGGVYMVCGTGTAEAVGSTSRGAGEPFTASYSPQPEIYPSPAPLAADLDAELVEIASAPETGVYLTKYRSAQELAQVARPLVPEVRMVASNEGARSGEVLGVSGGEIAYAGPETHVASLLALLEQLDARPDSVEIQAVLVEVSRTQNQSWGIEVLGDLLRDTLGVSISADRNRQQLEFQFGDVSTLLSTLSGDARVKVVSAPFVTAENGRRTQLTVGEEVPVLGAVHTSGDGTSQQSVEYRSSGMILGVVPRIYRRALYLDLEQEVSSFARTQTGVNNSPTLTKRQLTTSLEIPEGSWVALGGLLSDREERGGDRLFPRGPRVGGRETTAQAELVLLVRAVRRESGEP
ncbi:MAG: type II secretion system protein GspD [Brevundimonas sp.]|uniref:type II secretion system protein GspD n=1 Tax=Brevundimonas sp. TaxID=1871086 RepID=UPI00391B7239